LLLVSSNLAREKGNEEIAADCFLVDGVLASINFILDDPSFLLPLNAKSSGEMRADGEIPLSLQDTQSL
jgi:hypothetical protein